MYVLWWVCGRENVCYVVATVYNDTVTALSVYGMT